MHKYAFEADVDQTYLPVTMQQFETLTNELLVKFNEAMAPLSLDGNYMAQIVHGAVHQLDRKTAIVSKTELLDACINMVSKHTTFHAVQAIEAEMKAKKDLEQQSSPTDNVVSIEQDGA